MKTLGITQSTCNACRRIIPAKVVSDGSGVYFEKFCVEHGSSQNLIQPDIKDYLQTQRYVKPAWTPNVFAGKADAACPQGCGFCERHEQHLCMPVVEITSRCDMACPACIADAGREWDMTVTEFENLIEGLIRAENQVDILNLSGGEPLIHPDLLEIVDTALSRREIVRVSISTNGLALLDEPELVRELKRRDVVVSLQFDGFDEKAYEILRGRPLLKEKLAILDMLGETDIATSLTVTAAGGVNEDQFGAILDCFFSHRNIVSLMIQPISFAGRAANMARKAQRLTIPDVVRLLGQAGDSRVTAGDFAPLPCSHPLCFRLAYYLMLDDGGTVSLNQLVGTSQMMDALANRTVFGLDSREQDHLRDLIYEMWSGPAGAAPDSKAVMRTLAAILEEISGSGFDPRKAFTAAERHVKSIFIHAFQDVETFDLSRVRRCCQAYPQPDGRLIPICVHNVLGRKALGAK